MDLPEWNTSQGTPMETFDQVKALINSMGRRPDILVLDPIKVERWARHMEYVTALETSARVGYG